MWPFSTEVAGEAHAAFDHKTIYDQVHHGNGPSSLSGAVGSWQDDISTKFDEIHGLITTGLSQAHAAWQSSAADAFHGDVTPMAQFVLDAKQIAHTVGKVHEDQVTHFTDVRDKMPAPVEVTASDDWLSRGLAHITGDKTDKEIQEQQAMDASDNAARIYSDYRTSTTSTTSNVTVFPVVPQSNGIDTIPPEQPGDPLPHHPGDPGPLGPGGGPRTPHDTDQRGLVDRSPGQLPPGGTKLQDAPPSTPTPGPNPPIWNRPPLPPPPPPIGTPPPVIVPPPGVPIGDRDQPPGSGRGPGGSGRGPAGVSGGAGGSGTSGRAGSGSGPRPGGPGSGAGLGELEERGLAGRTAAGAPGRAGAAGGPGVGGPAGRGKGSKGEEDLEHTNKFLEPTDEHWGTGEKTVPPVIGEPGYQP
ncbi:PPE domain-containing protein [Kutzneria albida]|uniref:PPE domain-containing protein n=1 Tax=Kutzneria albida DSM 43870 TaxID=1449976 RepID=W5WK62_9PSEU|nr:PPE domain-containing protein [Kutzneria albida]AHH98569.1 hypothetical protein KALB_5207 [Kutzneria albida DSM 43870]